ncbi:amidohydrolase family protein [Hippea sp. KM1]|uniref:amidohydrolase family protein n=1 Tax=Hippea sp. KM1 TaxID=944481 RepID=UPI00046D4801|nr:amidohydrolase family protein [Hippea sp. KM1]
MRLLRAKYIFDGLRLSVDKGVVIDGDIVVDVDGFSVLKRAYPDIDVVDYGEGVLFCGFVNAHTHIELTYTKNRIEPFGGFIRWLSSIMNIKSIDVDDKDIERGINEAVKEIKGSGVFAVGDISNTLKTVNILSSELPRSVVFCENYSLNLERARGVVERLKREIEHINSFPVRVFVSPHSVYSSHPELMRFICNLPGIKSLHFLESEHERAFVCKKGELYGFLDGLGLVDCEFDYGDVWDYLKDVGCIKRGMLFVHAVFANRDDFKKIKDIGGSVVLCPRSNWYISKKLPDVYKIRESGVNIAIGTDSLSSNWDLDILKEIALIKQAFPLIDSEELFGWVSSGGAKALGIRLGFFRGYYARPYFLGASGSKPLDGILEEKKRGLPPPFNA